jgi:hypothetical protein
VFSDKQAKWLFIKTLERWLNGQNLDVYLWSVHAAVSCPLKSDFLLAQFAAE